MNEMEGLQEGRIVNYVLKGGKIRAAIVVNAWYRTGIVNVMVFLDGTNDGAAVGSPPMWRTSVHYSEDHEPETWHWPSKAYIEDKDPDSDPK